MTATPKIASSPVRVGGISSATTVSVGGFHSCATLAMGQVQCWGFASNWDSGGILGGIEFSPLPLTIAGISDARLVSSGVHHVCALMYSGQVRCWGSNQELQLGTKSVPASGSATPVLVTAASDATALVSGFYHSCALLKDGTVQCWGLISGECSNCGDQGPHDALPTAVSDVSNATALSAGNGFACALIDDGRVKCWGSTGHGGLGNGDQRFFSAPVFVSGISDAVRHLERDDA